MPSPDYNVPVGTISLFSGTIVPNGWAICNGSNGTQDLRTDFSGETKIVNRVVYIQKMEDVLDTFDSLDGYVKSII